MIAAGHAAAIDVAEVNGRVFVNNSSVGLYPDMVRFREAQQERTGRGKRLAMLSREPARRCALSAATGCGSARRGSRRRCARLCCSSATTATR